MNQPTLLDFVFRTSDDPALSQLGELHDLISLALSLAKHYVFPGCHTRQT
jgi:hypothetical protein